MHFTSQSQKYEPIPQQSPNISNMNHQYYQPHMPQYQNYQIYNNQNYFQNMYMPQHFGGQYGSQNYYNPMVHSNSEPSAELNPANKTKITEKRESKPLIVIDPNKNEVLDLIKISQSKTNSLLDEIQPADISQNQIPESNSNLETQHIEHVDIEEENSLIIESPVQCEESENTTILIEPHKKLSIPIKQSQSIPNKLDDLSTNKLTPQISSSSETDLYQKSNCSYEDLQQIFNNKRKIYNRNSLVEIRNSERSFIRPSPLEEFECKEIIVNGSTEITKLLEFKWFGQGKIINIGSKPSSLSRITNGYLPPHLRLIEECSLNKHLESCRRNLKCILNKIAPQNFNLCISEIKKIIKNSEPENVEIDDCIDCLIEEIFDKAVKEEAYSVTYANLCTHIAKIDDEKESKWNFKSSLLNRCKKMFETPLQDQLKSVKEHWEKKIEEEKDEKLKKLYSSDIEEQIKKARDKYFGNIRFIGELYLHDLLKPKIIHCCIQSLTPKSNDEDAMLSLCKLIETCGKKFNEKHGDKMTEYIKIMTEIIDNDQLETRIRFSILDIIEMSERNWSLRKIQAQKMIRPKTLDEVKNDDSEDKAMAASKFSSTKLHSRSINLKSSQNSNDLKFKQLQTRNQSIVVNSLSVGQNENLELKPSYGIWTDTKEKDVTEWINVDNKKANRGKFSQSSKYHQQNYNKASPVKCRDDSPGNLISKSKFSALILQDDANDSSLPFSNSPIRDHSPCDSKSEDEVLVMDGDELLDNLLAIKVLNVSAWMNQNDISELISHWLDRIMEKDKAARNLVGDQLVKLIECEKLSKNDFVNGLLVFMELMDDLITDIPKIWIFFAEFLERFIQDEKSYVEFFKTIFEKLLPNKNVSCCLLTILMFATDRLGDTFVKNLVDTHLDSLMKLILNDENTSTQLASYNLTFLQSDNILSTDKFSDSFKFKLISMLPNDTEMIYNLLESKFTPLEMQTQEFVYFMATCLFSFICDLSSQEEVINFIVEKQSFFKRIIDHQPTFEAETLLALVNFSSTLHEKDLLVTLIQNLSSKTISIDAFHQFSSSRELFSNDLKTHEKNYLILVNTIRSTLDNEER